MARITDGEANQKKSKERDSGRTRFLTTPVSMVSEPSTPGPSGVKVSDPSDSGDYEMDVTYELVFHP